MILEIALSILATYRIALMFSTEEGAFGIFDKVRERFDPKQETWLGRGLNCPLCIGFWIALVFALFLPNPLLSWFAVAGGQVLLQKWTERE